METTTAKVIKNDLKCSKMSEGNTCIAKPNLEVLPLNIYELTKSHIKIIFA